MKKKCIKKKKPKRVDLQAQAHLLRPRPAIFFYLKRLAHFYFFGKRNRQAIRHPRWYTMCCCGRKIKALGFISHKTHFSIHFNH